MEEGDSIANTIQPPAIDCAEIISKVVERTAEKQQQQMNQLTDMISTITSSISFQNQQQQVPNTSADNTPHSGKITAIANAGDNTPSNGVAPGNQMTGLINDEVGILAQGDNTSVKVAHSSRTAGHGHDGKFDDLIPPNGDNTPPKGVAPSRSGRKAHNKPHNGVGSQDPDDYTLSVQAPNVFFAIDDGKRPKKVNSSKDQEDQYQSRSSGSTIILIRF